MIVKHFSYPSSLFLLIKRFVYGQGRRKGEGGGNCKHFVYKVSVREEISAKRTFSEVAFKTPPPPPPPPP